MSLHEDRKPTEEEAAAILTLVRGGWLKLELTDPLAAHAPSDEAEVDHQPIAVVSIDGMAFVQCSCSDEYKPVPSVWLSEHWQGGDQDSGVAALRSVVDAQRLAASSRVGDESHE